MGPYFTSSKALESKFVLLCVLETVKLFHLHGLKTSLLVLVCDGASTNLSTKTATHGHVGAYPIVKGILSSSSLHDMNNTNMNLDQLDPYEISPCMINPFDPPHLLYWPGNR